MGNGFVMTIPSRIHGGADTVLERRQIRIDRKLMVALLIMRMTGLGHTASTRT
jgi:hypothetical protein